MCELQTVEMVNWQSHNWLHLVDQCWMWTQQQQHWRLIVGVPCYHCKLATKA